MFAAPLPLHAVPVIAAPLNEEEELLLAEALEGHETLEELLDHLLDLGDKEWAARHRGPARRPRS